MGFLSGTVPAFGGLRKRTSGLNLLKLSQKQLTNCGTWLAVDQPDVVDGEEGLAKALPASLDVDRDGEGVDVAAVPGLDTNPPVAKKLSG